MEGKSDKKDEIEQLLTLYCQGLATPEECTQVERWIDSSEENLKLASEVYHINRSVSDLEILQQIDTQKAYKKVNTQINKGRLRRIFVYVERCAAILFLPLLFFYLLEYYNKSVDVPQQMIEVRANAGSTTRVVLPDSSIVCLNGRSVLRYPQQFDANKRDVTLDGEAYFEVTHQPSRPFTVSIPQGMKVEVLGTKFNVDAYSDEELVSTTLIQGKVNFSHVVDGVDKTLAMRPGERVVFDKKDNSIEKYDVDAYNDLAWMEGKLIFDNTSIEEVAHELEKAYNIKILLKGTQLKSYSFTGRFEEQRIEPILETLRLSSNIQWKNCGIETTTGRKILELYIENNK